MPVRTYTWGINQLVYYAIAKSGLFLLNMVETRLTVVTLSHKNKTLGQARVTDVSSLPHSEG